jgi:hypothetical protein
MFSFILFDSYILIYTLLIQLQDFKELCILVTLDIITECDI